MPQNSPEIDIHLLSERRQIAIIWSIEDVQFVRKDLSDDQAWKVLKRCERALDASVGLDWSLIEEVADNLYPQEKEEEGELP